MLAWDRVEPNLNPHCLHCCLAGKGREEQNDRNSFFQSLRSKASCGPHILSSTLSSSTASGLSEQEALSASASRQPSLEPADLAASAHDAAYAASSSDAKQCNGNGTAHQVNLSSATSSHLAAPPRARNCTRIIVWPACRRLRSEVSSIIDGGYLQLQDAPS